MNAWKIAPISIKGPLRLDGRQLPGVPTNHDISRRSPTHRSRVRPPTTPLGGASFASPQRLSELFQFGMTGGSGFFPACLRSIYQAMQSLRGQRRQSA